MAAVPVTGPRAGGVPRLVIAAPASGSGKTTVATGLIAALRARGAVVAPFKVGPDYIDPGYHALAAGRPGRNLDPVLVGEDRVAPLFTHGVRDAEIAIVEGVMGLFDGRITTPPRRRAVDSGTASPTDGQAIRTSEAIPRGQVVSGREAFPDDEAVRGGAPMPVSGGRFGSTAHVARLLDAPVVLVVDARGQGQSLAALLHGFRGFEPGVRLAAVVLNQVGSDRHEDVLREACAETGLPVLGALRRGAEVALPSRHLGLVPAAEHGEPARRAVAAMADLVAGSVDLAAVGRLAATAGPLAAPAWDPAAALAAARSPHAPTPAPRASAPMPVPAHTAAVALGPTPTSAGRPPAPSARPPGPEPALDQDRALDRVPALDREPARAPEPSREPVPTREPELSREPVPAHVPVPVREAELSREPGPTREPEPVPSPVPVSVREAEPAREPVSALGMVAGVGPRRAAWPGPVVAVAGGAAFTFGYAEHAELLAAAGAEVVVVDPLRDSVLPPGTSALVLPGGFPEQHAASLSANTKLRENVARFALSGGIVHAECGGLLYLLDELAGEPMCGVVPGTAVMDARLTLGYRDAVAAVDSVAHLTGERVTGHEFHRTRITFPGNGPRSAWHWRGSDDRAVSEGAVTGNVHASYLHLHPAGNPASVARLVLAAASARGVDRSGR